MDRTRHLAALLAFRASFRCTRALVPAILIAMGVSGSGTSAHTLESNAIASAPEEPRVGGLWTRPEGTADPDGPSGDLRAFPPGPGRELFIARCGVCHTPRFVIGKQYDRPGWERIIDRMIRFGANVPAPDYQVIATYLSFHFREGGGSNLRRLRELPARHGANLGSGPQRPR